MTKVVWLPNKTDYSYCEFVATDPYSALTGTGTVVPVGHINYVYLSFPSCPEAQRPIQICLTFVCQLGGLATLCKAKQCRRNVSFSDWSLSLSRGSQLCYRPVF